MGARPVTLRIEPPVPFGDVTLVPAPLSKRPEADMCRAMVAHVEAPTASEVYRRLRQVFPRAPLSARVAVLAALIDRIRRPRTSHQA